MRILKTLIATGLGGAALLLGGCASNGYGYGGVSVGAGSYYGGGYGGLYGPYAGGGWYNDFYYPGYGYYVYDRGGRRSRWTPQQRQYWAARREYRGELRGDRRAYRVERRDDRQALRHGEVTRETFRADRRADRQTYRAERRVERRSFRQGVGRNPGIPRQRDIRPPRRPR